MLTITIIRRIVITVVIVAAVVFFTGCSGEADTGHGDISETDSVCDGSGGFPAGIPFDYREAHTSEREQALRCLESVVENDTQLTVLAQDMLVNDIFVQARATIGSIEAIEVERSWRSAPYLVPVIGTLDGENFTVLAWGDMKKLTGSQTTLDVGINYDFHDYHGESIEVQVRMYLMYTHTETPYYEVAQVAQTEAYQISFR